MEGGNVGKNTREKISTQKCLNSLVVESEKNMAVLTYKWTLIFKNW